MATRGWTVVLMIVILVYLTYACPLEIDPDIESQVSLEIGYLYSCLQCGGTQIPRVVDF